MPIGMAVIKKQKQKITSIDEGVEKLEHLGITGVNVNCCSHYGKKVAPIPKTLNVELPYDLSISLLDVTQEIENRDANKYLYTNVYCTLFIVAKR